MALGMNESFRAERLPLGAEAHHEGEVIADSDQEHHEAERHERQPKSSGLAATRSDHLRVGHALEELVDRETEADQRERRSKSPTSACGPRSCGSA